MARAMTPGWSLEPVSNGGPRGMIAHDITRLTDLSGVWALIVQGTFPSFPSPLPRDIVVPRGILVVRISVY